MENGTRSQVGGGDQHGAPYLRSARLVLALHLGRHTQRGGRRDLDATSTLNAPFKASLNDVQCLQYAI